MMMDVEIGMVCSRMPRTNGHHEKRGEKDGRDSPSGAPRRNQSCRHYDFRLWPPELLILERVDFCGSEAPGLWSGGSAILGG